MLVLTQLSVGGFVVQQWLASPWSGLSPELIAGTQPVSIAVALALGLLGMNASIFHLGRPLYAFRAVLGLRTSWLSREIVGFGAFAGAASLYTLSALGGYFGYAVPAGVVTSLGVLTALVGIAAVMCSVMIYVDTRREFWSLGVTTRKFLLTCAVLGIPMAILSAQVAAYAIAAVSPADVWQQVARPLWLALSIAMAVKLLAEASVFGALLESRITSLKRTALLMSGELARPTFGRFASGVLGGILLPAALLNSTPEFSDTASLAITAVSLALVLGGEILERYLFFAAVVAPKMPGSPAS
jgi:DMSO reductase anchor subunit